MVDPFQIAIDVAADVAARWPEAADTVRIVHGLPVDPADGERHWHAWVEVDIGTTRIAIDRSGGRNITVTASQYRTAGLIEQVWPFPPGDAAQLITATGHTGPWVPGWDTMTIQEPRRP